MKKKHSGKVRARVVWDEGNLEEIEANKPIRQKITEPKTPYHAPEYEDEFRSVSDEEKILDDAAHAEAIRTALSKVACTSSECSRQTGDSISSGDEAEEMEEDEVVNGNGNKPSFEELRRLHYDEFHKLKQLRQQSPVEKEDVEENGKERILI